MKRKGKIMHINPLYYNLITYEAMDYCAIYTHLAHRLMFKQMLSAILRLCLLSSALTLMAKENGPKKFS